MRSLLDSRAMSARSRRYGVAIAVFVVVATYAWAKPPDEPPPPTTPEAAATAESAAPEPPVTPVLTGEVTREQIEESPHGVERDLLALLDGSARGVVSARDDLQPPPP